jgi:phospholipid/cholesterol/gamma-HCH transport system substrate-binding protein
MRRAALIVVAIVMVTPAVLFGYQNLHYHKIALRVYFENANGLRAGAPVRLAGVDIGRITGVRARPEIEGAPAEVMMKVRTLTRYTSRTTQPCL